MKYLIKFNESFDSKEIYDKFMETYDECFHNFTDYDWNLTKSGNYPIFNNILIKSNYEYIKPYDRLEYVDYTGNINKNGEIEWDTKDLEFKSDVNKKEIKEDLDEFLLAIKRLNGLTGVDFNFSFNNRGGEMRIIIQGGIRTKYKY